MRVSQVSLPILPDENADLSQARLRRLYAVQHPLRERGIADADFPRDRVERFARFVAKGAQGRESDSGLVVMHGQAESKCSYFSWTLRANS
jgi:hypothetical protein